MAELIPENVGKGQHRGDVESTVMIARQDERTSASLRVSFLWTLAGNVLYAACQWGILITIAKLGTPVMVGQYAMGLAISAPILMLTNLQLRQIQATDAEDRFAFCDYLGLRVLATTLAALAIPLVAVASGLARGTTLVVMTVGWAKCIEALSDALYGHLQKLERMDQIARSMMVKGIVSLSIVTLLVIWNGTILVSTIGLGLAWAAVLLGYDIRCVRRSMREGLACKGTERTREREGIHARDATRMMPRIRRDRLIPLLAISLPMGGAMMLLALSNNIPRYLIERSMGERWVGYFTTLAYPGLAIGMLVGALGQSATPGLARAFKSDPSGFRHRILRLIALPVVVTIISVAGAVVCGEPLLSTIYKPEYARYGNIFVVLTLGAGIWSCESIVGYAATASQRFREQVYVTAVVAGIALGSGWYLVPRFGLMGAAEVTVISALVATVLYTILVVRAVHK